MKNVRDGSKQIMIGRQKTSNFVWIWSSNIWFLKPCSYKNSFKTWFLLIKKACIKCVQKLILHIKTHEYKSRENWKMVRVELMRKSSIEGLNQFQWNLELILRQVKDKFGRKDIKTKAAIASINCLIKKLSSWILLLIEKYLQMS